MSLVSTLKNAQHFLARNGWNESPFDEWRSKRVDVATALAQAASKPSEVSAAHELLEAIVLPSVARYNELGDQLLAADAGVEFAEFRAAAAAAAACISLEAWLRQPGRTQAQVLRAFDLAILKAQSRET